MLIGDIMTVFASWLSQHVQARTQWIAHNQAHLYKASTEPAVPQSGRAAKPLSPFPLEQGPRFNIDALTVVAELVSIEPFGT
jgi:hypothetical protein